MGVLSTGNSILKLSSSAQKQASANVFTKLPPRLLALSNQALSLSFIVILSVSRRLRAFLVSCKSVDTPGSSGLLLPSRFSTMQPTKKPTLSHLWLSACPATSPPSGPLTLPDIELVLSAQMLIKFGQLSGDLC